jgi:hypothetical protein
LERGFTGPFSKGRGRAKRWPSSEFNSQTLKTTKGERLCKNLTIQILSNFITLKTPMISGESNLREGKKINISVSIKSEFMRWNCARHLYINYSTMTMPRKTMARKCRQKKKFASSWPKDWRTFTKRDSSTGISNLKNVLISVHPTGGKVSMKWADFGLSKPLNDRGSISRRQTATKSPMIGLPLKYGR